MFTLAGRNKWKWGGGNGMPDGSNQGMETGGVEWNGLEGRMDGNGMDESTMRKNGMDGARTMQVEQQLGMGGSHCRVGRCGQPCCRW